jgi:AGZA family xanthine/uracil permease-like MFS transporter
MSFISIPTAFANPTTYFVALIFLYADFFNSTGTFYASLDMLEKDESEVKLKQAYIADAGASIASAVFGTNPGTTFIESMAGMSVGGRTGITSITVGILFLASIVLGPIFTAIPAFATGGVLVMVGILMFSNIEKQDTGNFDQIILTFIGIMTTIVLGSITSGFGMVMITFVVIKAVQME